MRYAKENHRLNERYGQTPQRPSPVLSISLFDGVAGDADLRSERARLQVVVRDPQTNATHPNVISMPTQRIPRSLFRAITASAEREAVIGATTFYEAGEIDNLSPSPHHPVVYAVENLLSRKLGVADALESGALGFRAALRAVTLGKSVYSDNESSERTEHIAMANVRVIVTCGAEYFPARTPSYSTIFWVSVDQFMKTVQQKDPLILNLNPFEYCIHGLCISTAYDLLAHRFGFKRYAELSEF